jgi:hypothetical protein
LASLGMFCETAGMNINRAGVNNAGRSFQFFSSSVSPHMPLLQS